MKNAQQYLTNITQVHSDPNYSETIFKKKQFVWIG